MEIPIFRDLAVIFGIAILVLWICSRLRIPIIVGFLFTGVLSGPHGLGLVKHIADVDTLAHVGILLLLFSIGLESSRSLLLEAKKFFFVGGTIQVALTTVIGFCIGLFMNRPLGESLFLGFLLAMSSTAIVLKELKSQDLTDSLQGRLSLGILIFQDFIAVPFILVTPLLGAAHAGVDFVLLFKLFVGMALMGVVFLAATKIVPLFLHVIAKARSRELFLLSVLAICFAVAWIASSIGLSLAIGAFLAGLLISDSEYKHEALGNILPLQDIFASLFFVSTGMLLDLHFFFEQPITILLIALAVILMKALVVGFTAYWLEMPFRVIVMSAIALSQIGEFAFVLARTGQDNNIGTEYYYQLFYVVALLTMALSPIILRYASPIVSLLQKIPLPIALKKGMLPQEQKEKLKDHTVIIGFGLAGMNLARAAAKAAIAYSVIETNPDTVRIQKKNGQPIFFGDAVHEEILHHVNVPEAKIIAIMINDPTAIRHIVPLVRKLNSNAYIIVRTRYVKEIPIMIHLGASDVITDELGSSIELFTKVLQQYEVPQTTIDLFTSLLHSDSRKLARSN